MSLSTFLIRYTLAYHCTENHIFFFRTSWKNGLSKKIALEYDLSCIIGKNDISFSRKYHLTRLLTENERWSFLKNTRKYGIFFKLSENMVFPGGAMPAHNLPCIIWKDCIFFPKTWFFSTGQEVNNRPSQEKHGNMMHCPAKKQETWYIGLKFSPSGLSLNLFGWKYSTMNNLQYLVPFSPQELCLWEYLSANNRGNHLSIRG